MTFSLQVGDLITVKKHRGRNQRRCTTMILLLYGQRSLHTSALKSIVLYLIIFYQGSVEHETDEEPGLEHSQRHRDSVLVEEGGHQEHDGDRPPSGPTCIDELILEMSTRD